MTVNQFPYFHVLQAGHVCGDARDLVDGLPTGSVRVSFGYMSTYTDADQLLRMVRECFIQGTPRLDTTWMLGMLSDCNGEFESRAKNGTQNGVPDKKLQGPVLQQQDKQEPQKNIEDETVTQLHENKEYHKEREDTNSFNSHHHHHHHTSQNETLWLTDIFLYPVKSCGGQRVEEWPMGCSGLEYDRGWMVVTEAGVTLTLKRAPRMALISPRVDLTSQMLILRCEGNCIICVLLLLLLYLSW